jgi:DNA-binding GntR family transcriptional regulator
MRRDLMPLNSSVSEIAYVELKRQIVDGLLAEGDRVVIDSIARQLGISIVPVREALTRLHVEGLVTFQRNKGYWVAPAPTAIQISKMFQARQVLEASAVEIGFASVDEQFLADLEELNLRMSKTGRLKKFEGIKQFVELNRIFHMKLVSLAHNQYIEEAYNLIRYHENIPRWMAEKGVFDLDINIQEHNSIIESLRSGSIGAARRAIEEHVKSGCARTLPMPADRR